MAPKKTPARTPKGKAKKKQPEKAKAAPKAAPKSVVKKPQEIEGERPLSLFDLQFCQLYVQTQRQAATYRQLKPEEKDPHVAAHRMMQRPEIREQIRLIYKEISAYRKQAAKVGARSALLTLELADDRLVEILEQPRKTRGEMFTKDTKNVFTPADLRTQPEPLPPVEGETGDEAAAREEYNAVAAEAGRMASAIKTDRWLQEAAPVEDADLLKAVKLVYERRQGIIKADKEPEKSVVATMLYTPSWRGKAKLIEGEAE